MLKSLSCLLTFGLAQATAPFWQAKPKLLERVHAREVIVSVFTRETSAVSPKNTLTAGGGGQVRTPCDFAFRSAQQLNDLSRASEYIKRSKYDAQTRLLELDLEAYSHKATLRIEILPREPRELGYKVLSGPMQGFHGALTFDPQGAKCDIGFAGIYQYDQFPIPKLFLEFGMEVVLQRMAYRTREFLEDLYKKAKIT